MPRASALCVLAAVGAATTWGCGGGADGGGDKPYCYTVPFMGAVNCCPVRWTKEVPAGGSVQVAEAGYLDCNLSVETACLRGDCPGIRVKIGTQEVAVPARAEFTHLAVPEVRATNTGASSGEVVLLISGECTICMAI